MKVWTAQYNYKGPKRLDITVKGNDPFGRFFAPTWDMVKEHKRTNNNQAYIIKYHELLKQNFSYLQQLLLEDEVVLVCFCPPGVFCHRLLLVHYLVEMGATYMGEITTKQEEPVIGDFHKKGYEWLSNFHPSPFTYQGILYPTNEHFFQAWKFPEDKRREIAALATPGLAKRAGRKATLCWNWTAIRDEIMYTGLKCKFEIPELRTKLIATGTTYLIEGNYWHDNYWGDCYCPKCTSIDGENKLGKLLMTLRSTL